MAKKRSTERRLAEQLVRGMSRVSRGRRGNRGNGGGGKGLSFVPLILIAILCGWTQCNPVQVFEPEKSESVSTEPTSTSPSADYTSSTSDYASDPAPYSAEQTSTTTDTPSFDYVDLDGASPTEQSYNAPPPPSTYGERVRIERVVDGDTFIVQSSNGQERVRLIGANTPETVKKDIRDLIQITSNPDKARYGKGRKTDRKGAEKLSKREKEDMVSHLRAEMQKAAKELRFEEAAYLRDKIRAIESSEEK